MRPVVQLRTQNTCEHVTEVRSSCVNEVLLLDISMRLNLIHQVIREVTLSHLSNNAYNGCTN